MAQTTIDRLIINSPYEEPKHYWRYDRKTHTFDLVEGRRPAGYLVATPGSKSFDAPGTFMEIPLVNQIRPRVKAGWDAKTMTHIMGLRAFTSQLLCEQVVGRGLRRTSYEVNPETGFFEPEYVNIFGVPFTFLPHEGGVKAAHRRPRHPRRRSNPIRPRQRLKFAGRTWYASSASFSPCGRWTGRRRGRWSWTRRRRRR